MYISSEEIQYTKVGDKEWYIALNPYPNIKIEINVESSKLCRFHSFNI